MDPLLNLKEKGEATMEAEEIQSPDGQSAVTSNNKYVLEKIAAFAFMVYSFTLMCIVVGGVGIGRFIRGDIIRFSIFLVADTLVFVASSAVTKILATRLHVSATMEYFINITLWAGGVFFVFISHAIAYVVAPPNLKWFALCFGGVSLALLLFHQRLKVFFQ